MFPKTEGKEHWAENSLCSGIQSRDSCCGEHSGKGRECQRGERSPGSVRTHNSCPELVNTSRALLLTKAIKHLEVQAGEKLWNSPFYFMEQPFAGNAKGEEIKVQRPHPNPIFCSIRIA